VTYALRGLPVPEHGEITQRGFDPPIRAEKGPPGAGRCDVPGIFVNDPGEVWKLPDPIVT